MSCTSLPYRIRAVSADERFLDRLRSGSFAGHVQSVFTRVVNIESAPGGALCTIACSGIDNAPGTLVAAAASFDRLGLAPRASASCDGATLVVGASLEISLQRIERWSPTLAEWPGDDMPVDWLRELIARCGRDGGIKQTTGAVRSYDARLARRLGDAVASLQAALLAGDASAAHEHGMRLVGLGPGLTPAGDDFLVGLATACNQPSSPVGHLRPLLAQLTAEAADRTNVISHAAMVQAAEGRVRESISELVNAMARGDRAAMERRGAQVMSIGATSGTDILTGLLAGLELAEAGRG